MSTVIIEKTIEETIEITLPEKKQLIQIQKFIDGKWQKLEITEEEFAEMMTSSEIYDENNLRIGWFDVDSNDDSDASDNSSDNTTVVAAGDDSDESSDSSDDSTVVTDDSSNTNNADSSESTSAQDTNPVVSVEQQIVIPVELAGDTSSNNDLI